MQERRRTDNPRLLCAGPGRLCEALGVTGAHDGLRLDREPFELRARPQPVEIATAPRHRITRATEPAGRYVLAGSRYPSRAVPRA